MNSTHSCLHPLASFEQLVSEIITINKAWKVACETGDSNSQIATSIKNIKTRWQVRLLRLYAPERVYLKLEAETHSEEELYGLLLREPIDGYADLTHLPVRVARSRLSAEEILKFSDL